MTLPLAPSPMTTRDLSLKAKAMTQVVLAYMVPVATSKSWPDLTLLGHLDAGGKRSSLGLSTIYD